jgi:hypothetical protein
VDLRGGKTASEFICREEDGLSEVRY